MYPRTRGEGSEELVGEDAATWRKVLLGALMFERKERATMEEIVRILPRELESGGESNRLTPYRHVF